MIKFNIIINKIISCCNSLCRMMIGAIYTLTPNRSILGKDFLIWTYWGSRHRLLQHDIIFFYYDMKLNRYNISYILIILHHIILNNVIQYYIISNYDYIV